MAKKARILRELEKKSDGSDIRREEQDELRREQTFHDAIFRAQDKRPFYDPY